MNNSDEVRLICRHLSLGGYMRRSRKGHSELFRRENINAVFKRKHADFQGYS